VRRKSKAVRQSFQCCLAFANRTKAWRGWPGWAPKDRPGHASTQRDWQKLVRPRSDDNTRVGSSGGTHSLPLLAAAITRVPHEYCNRLVQGSSLILINAGLSGSGRSGFTAQSSAAQLEREPSIQSTRSWTDEPVASAHRRINSSSSSSGCRRMILSMTCSAGVERREG
jgi:hypothetical protein